MKHRELIFEEPPRSLEKCTLAIFTVKRLWFFDDSYWTYGGFPLYLHSMAGACRHIILVAKVFKSKPPEGCVEIKIANLSVVHLPSVSKEWQNLIAAPIFLWRAWKVSRDADIINARVPDLIGLAGIVAARVRHKPLFVQVVADWHLQAKSVRWSKKFGLGFFLKIYLLVYDLLERLLCQDQLVFAQGENCYEKHRERSQCILVVSTAHRDRDIVTTLSPKFGSPPFTILNVARLDTVKNQELLIAAISGLCSTSDKWRLIIAGEGSRRSLLEKLIKASGLGERVFLAGGLRHDEELWKLYDSADVFVLPSRSEGTPKVLLEAMARGLPVIASAVSGVPTIVKDRINGLLFPDNDLNKLLACLASISGESDLREDIRRNGLITAKAHTLELEHRYLVSTLNSHLGGLSGPSCHE